MRLVAAEADVGAPLAGDSRPFGRADHAPAGHQHAEVTPSRGHELLDEGAVAPKPASTGDPPQELSCLLLGVAAVDVLPPAAEPRLDGEWGGDLDPIVRRADPLRARLGDGCSREQPVGAQLVVGGEQGRGGVPDLHAPALEQEQVEEARLDAVEPGENVEPADRDVSDLERRSPRPETRRARSPRRHQDSASRTVVWLAPPPTRATSCTTDLLRGKDRVSRGRRHR